MPSCLPCMVWVIGRPEVLFSEERLEILSQGPAKVRMFGFENMVIKIQVSKLNNIPNFLSSLLLTLY